MPFLGVDGGGTKTAFALISPSGNLLGSVVLGPTHPDQVGMERVRETLKDGVAAVCQQAGIEPQDVKFAFFGLAGFGENLEHTAQFQAVAGQLLPNSPHRCGNDVEAGWAGSLACQPGVHLVAGTGAIGFGVDPKGNTARSSGWDSLFGDEGSAYWLGRHLLGLFTKESDGRLPKSPLYDIVREKLGLERDLDLLAKLDLWSKRDELARLALLAHAAAEQGDKNTIALFREAALELSLAVKAIIQRLEYCHNTPIPVSYSGGVFRSRRLHPAATEGVPRTPQRHLG